MNNKNYTIMSSEITNVASGGSAPDEVKRFAERISQKHGCRVLLAREANGYHLYLPCPACLETHGRKELADPKYAINVSKYLGLGDSYRDLKQDAQQMYDPTAMLAGMESIRTREEKSSVCMRTRQDKSPHRFSIPDLLALPSVTERHPDIMTKAEIVGQAGSADKEQHWEVDEESGQLCPPPPGKVVPITSLPPEHPAVEYLTWRGFDVQKLWEQFRCSWCYEEYPAKTNGIFYRRMPGRWCDTPQHRIIFYSLINGVPLTWQARSPEKLSADGLHKYILHPYTDAYSDDMFQWSHVATRSNPHAAWIPVPPYDEVDESGTLKFQPSKYRTAKYSTRQMMGWDAAVDRAARDADPNKWVVLCEGPLDAARVGPGGVALIGSSISPDNAAKVAGTFHIVFTAFDEDKAGRGATEKVNKMVMNSHNRSPIVQLVIPLPIPSGKDIGEMKQEVFDEMLTRAIKKSKRGM